MNCSICSNKLDEIFVAKSPISGYRCDSLKESQLQPSFDLIFQYCKSCKMINYKYHPEAGQVLDRLYIGHTATYYFTPQINEYMNSFVDSIINEYGISSYSNVLEIGCNSGRMLTLFKGKTGCNIYGVEPSKTFKKLWESENINVINDYFNRIVANKLSDKKYDIIFFRHVFEHIQDPLGFFGDIASICSSKTIIIIEVPCFTTVVNKKRIDNISYSHLNYFTNYSINKIVEKFGMGIKKSYKVETDGGSMVLHIQRDIKTDLNQLDFIEKIEIKKLINSIKKQKKNIKNKISKYKINEIVGYGAGAKGQHLIHVLELQNSINIVLDDTPGYENKYIPGTSIIIKHPDLLKTGKFKAVINLAPTHSEAIKANVPSNIEYIEII